MLIMPRLRPTTLRAVAAARLWMIAGYTAEAVPVSHTCSHPSSHFHPMATSSGWEHSDGGEQIAVVDGA
jgi:hypothetical protein